MYTNRYARSGADPGYEVKGGASFRQGVWAALVGGPEDDFKFLNICKYKTYKIPSKPSAMQKYKKHFFFLMNGCKLIS